VVRDAAGARRGVAAVIDKDLASALLARELRADGLVMLTDVSAVYEHWSTPRQRAIGRTTPAALRAMTFAPGSMAPKVEAACRFVEATGGFAAIGALEDGEAIVASRSGTRVERDAPARR
jgi:carbamate kinase